MPARRLTGICTECRQIGPLRDDLCARCHAQRQRDDNEDARRAAPWTEAQIDRLLRAGHAYRQATLYRQRHEWGPSYGEFVAATDRRSPSHAGINTGRKDCTDCAAAAD